MSHQTKRSQSPLLFIGSKNVASHVSHALKRSNVFSKYRFRRAPKLNPVFLAGYSVLVICDPKGGNMVEIITFITEARKAGKKARIILLTGRMSIVRFALATVLGASADYTELESVTFGNAAHFISLVEQALE